MPLQRSFACTEHIRRLAQDYERLPVAFIGLHLVAFVRSCSIEQQRCSRPITRPTKEAWPWVCAGCSLGWRWPRFARH